MILVISHQRDDHAAEVLETLRRLGHPAVLVDTARFPQEIAVRQTFHEGNISFDISVDGRDVNLSNCRAGWWRRPQSYGLHPGMAPDVAAFSYSECHETMAGMWAALPLRWVNPPYLDEVAHHKPFQLALAPAVGLSTPRTLITNDPAAARRFVEEVGRGRTIYKTFIATEQNWRETRIVQSEEMAILDSVSLAPVIFQEFVPATEDLRVTVIGEEIFPASIRSASGGYAVDYRMDLSGASFRPTQLEPETEKGIRALMQRLGLYYGAIDFRRTAQGEEIFLEINPAGEWLFIEERTGQPMTQAMAHLLSTLDSR